MLTDATIVHVKAQNAGLLLFRTDAESVLVHAFEASAQSPNVMGSCDRLTWRFPGQTISFPSHLLNNNAFVNEMTTMVLQMGAEPVKSSMQTTKKAQSIVPEERETVHPKLVTQALMAMLCAWGGSCQNPEIIKHVRDDVNWNQTKLLWRRSPFWLVTRVSIQILLSHTYTAEEGRIQYKNFMAFFIARICSNIVSEPVDADLKMIAAMKAARRLSKLEGNAFPFVADAVQSAVANIRARLDSSWSEFQAQESPSIPRLPTEATNDDCALHLNNSREYLRAVLFGQDEKLKLSTIDLETGPRLEFKADGLPHLHRTSDTVHNLFLLTDFETWTMQSLHSWMESREGSESDCNSLLNEMRTYLELAREEYQGNPRALSVMLQVTLEMWMALDTFCLQLYPLMRKFGPEIPKDLGNPLLLPHLSQMKNLDHFEDHLAMRWEESESDNPSILGQLSSRSFSVRFYAQSQVHQAMRKEIEDEASERRAHKHSEWVERSEHYRMLLHEASRIEHSQFIDRWGEWECQSNCPKCSKESLAGHMRIEVDEWPLPANEVQAQAAVFELDCPAGFSAWRDATWLIVQHLGRAEYSRGDDVRQMLLEYSPLMPYASREEGRIVTLASHTKSFLRSHYREESFPVAFESIAVNNGLLYKLIDQGMGNCWVQDQTSPPSFDRHCISLLPNGPYLNLQEFVNTTSRTPNESLAAQQKCHIEITSHEYLAFSSLRAGERIQWLNIIRELGSADLSFNATAVHVLIRQAALQAGSRAVHTVLREAHKPFKDPKFCARLVGLLGSHLSNITSNWKEQSRLATIALLGLRTLMLSTEPSTACIAMQLLRDVREVALGWCRDISSNIHKCNTEVESRRMGAFLVRSALTCRMTYDTDQDSVHLVLANQCDVAHFVESSIYLNDNYSAHQKDLPAGIRQSVLVDRKLSRCVASRFRDLIKVLGSSVNDGIKNAHGLTGLDTHWDFVAGKEERWVSCTLTLKPDSFKQTCHYDVLCGTLLLDGRRIGRLPPQYMSAPLYSRIFGSVSLTPWLFHSQKTC